MKAFSSNELTVRRKFARYEFHVDAEIVRQPCKQYDRVTNISRGGTFIELPDPPCLGAHFTAYLALNAPLRINCTVHRMVSNRGVGVTSSVESRDQNRSEALLLALGGEAPIVRGLSVSKRRLARNSEAVIR